MDVLLTRGSTPRARLTARSLRRLCLVVALAASGCVAWPQLVTRAHAGTDTGGIWGPTDRTLARTPLGNRAAVSCHNCYVSWSGNTAAVNLSATLSKIHAAQQAGADMIELDVKSESGVTYVTHDDNTATNLARLSDVLNDPALQSGDQLLAVELKETTTSAAFVDDVLATIRVTGYARSGRPVLIKAFTGAPLTNLQIVHDDLNAAYASMSPNVRTSVIYPANNWSLPQFRQSVQSMHDAGYHAVDLDVTTPGLAGVIQFAKSIGVAVGLWTFPAGSEATIAAMREAVDYITADVPIATTRALMTVDNGLSSFDVTNQTGTGGTILVNAAAGAVTSSPVNSSTDPSLTSDPTGGAGLTGNYLRFASPSGLHMTLYGMDNATSGGYIVSVVASFEKLSIGIGTTAVLLGKGSPGGFSLELAYPAGTTAAVLRFGVFVNGGYRYATYPASLLKLGTSYVITGAYNGQGPVSMWVANSTTNVTTSPSYNGGVGLDNLPATVGAEPQTNGSAAAFFDGKIQSASVLSWAPDTLSNPTATTTTTTTATTTTTTTTSTTSTTAAPATTAPPADSTSTTAVADTTSTTVPTATTVTPSPTVVSTPPSTTTPPATTTTTAAPPTTAKDTTAPVVTITAPLAGANVKGWVTLSASATDVSGVTQAKWYVDGVQVAWDGSAPFSAAWNSATKANGQHTVFAKAADPFNNWGTSKVVTITIAN